MIELLILLVLVSGVLFLIRPGRMPPLESPLVIDGSNSFHATLAPQLHQALPLIEEISHQLLEIALPPGESETLCFRVETLGDEVSGSNFYLLALTLRAGRLYFQAIPPTQAARNLAAEGHFKVLADYAAAVLVSIPAAQAIPRVGSMLSEQVCRVADLRGIRIVRLQPGD